MINPFDFNPWLDHAPYSLASKEKSELFLNAMKILTHWHTSKCDSYARILSALQVQPEKLSRLQDIPYLPVRLFKEFDLHSVGPEEIFKIMTSSGTSSQQVSRIYLDKQTAFLQTKALSRLMAEVLGKKRIPMLVVDSPSVLKDRLSFSARGAGILGFSMFGQDVTYALDDDMRLNEAAVHEFLLRHPDCPIFVFGFTFIIWQYLVQPLLERTVSLPLDRAIVLHGGGWKKLQNQAVDNHAFRKGIKKVLGAQQVVNYYGMVEQTGSLYLECEYGHLHAPVYSDIIVRRVYDFAPAEIGEEGLIEVLSILPCSYPGHALLTEDLGVILGSDNCLCGRLGTYFHVNGRLAQAEVRGCSDTHEIRP